MELTDTVLVVESPYKNYTHTFDDGVYLAQVEEMDGPDFADAVILGDVAEEFEFVPAGTIPVQVYRIQRKVRV